jgi:hypothetical protein
VTVTHRRNERSLVAPEAELALLLIGTRHRRERLAGRITELAVTVDQDALAAVLTEQRVFLLGATRLVQSEPDAVGTRFRRRLDRAVPIARARARGFGTVTSGVVDALERAGIPAVALKGSVLAGRLYSDEALREYADVDVLVARSELARATSVVRGLGWVEAPSAELPRLHRLLYHPGASLPVVELHWRIHWYEARFAEALLDRSRMRDGVRQLDDLDELAALLLFYARDGLAGLRYAADVAAWWDRHGSPTVSARLEGLMAEHPELAEPWRAALLAAMAIGGLPDDAAPPSCRPRSRRGGLAVRLANWDLSGEPDQVNANVAFMDGLLAPRPVLRAFLRRQLLPASTALPTPRGPEPAADSRHRDRGGRHAAKLLLRFILALWRLRRGRRWSALPASVGQPDV